MDRYLSEFSQTQDKIQKLNKGIEFMNKKFMRPSHSERFSEVISLFLIFQSVSWMNAEKN